MSKLLFIQFVNPASLPPILHGSELLTRAGWRVELVGVEGWGALSRLQWDGPPIRIDLVSGSSDGIRGKILYLRFSLACLWSAVRRRPTYIYASDLFSCPIALVIHLILRIKVVYHEHDAPALDLTNLRARWAMRARRWIGQRADACVFPSEGRRNHFLEQSGQVRRALIAPNYPMRGEADRAHRPTNHTMRVVYQGSINPVRFPPHLLTAISHLPSIDVTVIGYETIGSRGYLTELRTLSRELSIESRVHLVGTISRNQMLELLDDHDVGLSLHPMQPPDVNHRYMVGASNKAYEYLAKGLAILVPDTPEWVSEFVTPGYGLPCDTNDYSSIEGALAWFQQHPDETRAMGETGRQRVLKDWNYESGFSVVMDTIGATLVSGVSPPTDTRTAAGPR